MFGWPVESEGLISIIIDRRPNGNAVYVSSVISSASVYVGDFKSELFLMFFQKKIYYSGIFQYYTFQIQSEWYKLITKR